MQRGKWWNKKKIVSLEMKCTESKMSQRNGKHEDSSHGIISCRKFRNKWKYIVEISNMNSYIWLIRDGRIIYVCVYVYNPVELDGSCVADICVLFEECFIQFIKATLEPTSRALTCLCVHPFIIVWEAISIVILVNAIYYGSHVKCLVQCWAKR